MGKVDFISQIVIGAAIVFTAFHIVKRISFVNTFLQQLMEVAAWLFLVIELLSHLCFEMHETICYFRE